MQSVSYGAAILHEYVNTEVLWIRMSRQQVADFIQLLLMAIISLVEMLVVMMKLNQVQGVDNTVFASITTISRKNFSDPMGRDDIFLPPPKLVIALLSMTLSLFQVRVSCIFVGTKFGATPLE